jgi:mRNA turnover protein 4
MGKTSKRAQQVSLTKVKPKGKELKSKLFAQVRSFIDLYQSVFVFSFENFKTEPLLKLRESSTNSKFLLGKSKVLKKALASTGRSDIEKLNKHLTGTCGLLFTNEEVQSVVEFFLTWKENSPLLPGQVACESIVLNAGSGLFDKFSNTIEPYLRKLGLATRVHEGKIELLADFVVCRQGEPVTVEQTKVLKLLDQEHGEMKFQMHAMWKDGEYKSLEN